MEGHFDRLRTHLRALDEALEAVWEPSDEDLRRKNAQLGRLVRPLPEGEASFEERALVFCCGEKRLAVSATAVLAVVNLDQHALVPNAPPGIFGARPFRGEILVLVELDHFMDSVRGLASQDRVVVVEHEGARLGILVQKVEGLSPISRAEHRAELLDAGDLVDMVRERLERGPQ